MTIKSAISQVIESERFREKAKTDAKLRVFKGRFISGKIKPGAAIQILTKFGYRIEVYLNKA